LAYAEYNLIQTTVYAPSDGYITNLQLVNGAYIDVGDAVLTFVDDESWWVVANFRENSIGRIRTGQSAEISIAMYPGKIFKAVVENADWGVSAGQGIPSGDLPDVENPENWFNLSQRFPVRIKITNLDEEISTSGWRYGKRRSVYGRRICSKQPCQFLAPYRKHRGLCLLILLDVSPIKYT